MTPDVIIVLSILAIATLLFITEWVRVDIVALLVMFAAGAGARFLRDG